MSHIWDPHLQPYISAPEHIIFTHTHTHTHTHTQKKSLQSITILEFLPLRRPSLSKFSYTFKPFRRVAAHGRFTAASPNAKSSPSAPGYSRPECQPDACYKSAPETPNSHARSRSRAPHFHARAAPEPPPPPFFTLAVAHIPIKMWAECPPPPLSW